MQLVFAFILFWGAGFRVSGAPPEQIRAGVTFSIPTAYLTPEGEAAGFYVDVFQEAAKRENINLKMVIGRTPPDRFLESGAGEIWVAAVGTKERRSKFHVTEPWWILDTYLAVMASSEISSQHDLAGKKLLYTNSPPFSVPMSEFLRGAEARVEDNVTARFEALCSGQADGVLFYETTVHRMLGAQEFTECRERGIRIIAFDRPVRQLSIMSVAGSKDVAERLRARIETMKRDGTMERLPSFRLTGNELWKAELEAERTRKEQQLWRFGMLFTVLLLGGGAFAYLRLRAAHMEVQKSLELAQEAVQAKSEFLATMSHEIRTPMTAVLGYMDLMKATPLRPDQRWFAREVTQATTSLLSMLTEVLDYSRSIKGVRQLMREPFDVVSVIDDCVAAVQLQAEEKGLELIANIAPSVPAQLTGDAGRLRQMILNLLTNAVKFTPAGSVELQAEYVVEGREGRLRVAVADSGVGIPQDQQEGIFLPFTQVDSTHTRSQGGIGLGLAIVNTLCEQMGGKVSLRSSAGEGSEFTLELPMAGPGTEEGWLAGRDANGTASAVTLWNESRQIAALERYLSLSGYVLERTDSVEEFLRAAEQAEARGGRLLLLIEGERCSDADIDALSVWKQNRGPGIGLLVMVGSLRYLRDCSRQAKGLPDTFLALPAPGRALREILSSTEKQGPAEEIRIGLTVLVADDNAVNRRVLSAMLNRLGCTVETAVNGAEAVERVKLSRYSLVLMDCQMPVMNGFEAAQRIRNDVSGAVPIWGVSAGLGAEIRQQCLDSGMNDYMAKPVTFEDLKARLLPLQRG